MRVRNLLDSLRDHEKAALKKLLPTGLRCPSYDTEQYPTAIVRKLGYDGMGVIAEAMLCHHSTDITLESLGSILESVAQLDPESIKKIKKSVTTPRFLECLKITKEKMEEFDLDLEYEREISKGTLQGHPDFFHPTHIFEVKCTGKLRAGWTYFLLQTFSYGAISECSKLSIVLPLQKEVWTCDISKWKKRNNFYEFLCSKALEAPQKQLEETIGQLFVSTRPIGWHVSKSKIVKTFASLDIARPYQIYLASPQKVQITITEQEIEAASKYTAQGLNMFVHVPHTLNLSADFADSPDWIVENLQKHLICSSRLGVKGVVVHVGKHTTRTPEKGLELMRDRILAALPSATEECPLLIETPAGQGTELLTDPDEFLNFISWFDDRRVRMCLDTCHVFSSGVEPLEYLEKATSLDPDLIRLVHYNDSKVEFGKCVDLHAAIGTGFIGFRKMKEIADKCMEHNYPMVIE